MGCFLFFFFFQAEDGIRDATVTGVQTCALPIWAGAVLGVIRDAAPVDPDIAALWGRIQAEFYDNQRAIVETLQKRKALRSGLDVTGATDILWTLNHPDVWLLLVGGRGWTPEQYEQWFGDTICAQLLKDSTRRRSATSDNRRAPRS